MTTDSMPLGTIALVGSPNSGKTALFNALTGLNQKTGNYPGVTVEKKTGKFKTEQGEDITVVDLPGTYSLHPQSLDEEVTLDVLLRRQESDDPDPQLILAVADATNLRRSLNFVLELKSLELPVVLALNMMDLAKQRGMELDLEVLSRELGLPVVPTVAVQREGISALIARIKDELPAADAKLSPKAPPADRRSADIQGRYVQVEEVIGKALVRPLEPDKVTKSIDRLVLHPVIGLLTLTGIMFTIFQAVFTWSGPLAEYVELGFGALATGVTALLGETMLTSLLVDGVIAGVGGVLVFLPQIILLFLFILILEGSGYMARAAFMLDRLMGKFGLQGRAFIPLLSSFACAIPGIMAARAMRSEKDRLVTILVAPLMTCSARLPVYVLLISAFVPNTSVLGPIRMQGLVMFGLYVAGIVAAVGVAFVMKTLVVKGRHSPFILEMPGYKVPDWRMVMRGLWARAWVFTKRAGTVILALTIILWALATFPQPPADYEGPAINHSYAGKIGHAVEPLVRPLGFDWRIATSMIPGFAAREVMVGALGTVFAIEAADEAATEVALSSRIQQAWGLPTALALLVWYIFSPQCISTFAVARRETGGYKWPIIMFAYLLALAYVFALLTYQVASALT